MKFSISHVVVLSFLISSCLSMKTSKNGLPDIDIPMKETDNTAVKGETSKDKESELSRDIKTEGPEWQTFFKPPDQFDDVSIGQEASTAKEANSEIGYLLKKARLDFLLGAFADAETGYRKILHLLPTGIDAPLEIAMIRIKKKQVHEAFRWLEDIKGRIEKNESSPQHVLLRYRYTLALAYDLAKNTKKSREILTDILKIDFKFAPAYTALAASYINRDKLDAADFVINRGLSRIAKNPSLENLKALIFDRRGNIDLASEAYTKILITNPDFIPALINKAILSLRTNDLEQSQRLLSKVLSIQKKHPEALSTLAALYMKTNRLDDAQGLLEQVLSMDPHDTKTRYNLALVRLYSEKKPYQALRLFYEVLQTSGPEDGSIHSSAKTYIEDIKHASLSRHQKTK